MPQQHRNKLKIPVLLTPEQHARVKQCADARGIGVGTQIRLIVDEWLRTDEREAQRQRAREGK